MTPEELLQRRREAARDRVGGGGSRACLKQLLRMCVCFCLICGFNLLKEGRFIPPGGGQGHPPPALASAAKLALFQTGAILSSG